MAHFYGIVRGSRGEATRCGTKNSGLGTIAASHQGAVDVILSTIDGVDSVVVALIPWQGSGIHRVLYAGPVSGEQMT